MKSKHPNPDRGSDADLRETDLPDTDLKKLFEAERQRTELPPESIDSEWGALEARVAKISAVAGAGAAASAWTSRMLWTTVGIATITFGTGVGVGRWLGRSSSEPAPITTSAVVAQASTAPGPNTSDPAIFQPSQGTSPTVDPIAPPPDPQPGLPRSPLDPSLASRAPTDRAPTPATASSLADERALVEGARTALLRGRPSDALIMTEQHENKFPNGELSEDRDFLRVSALRDLGRMDEARQDARIFVVKYPRSALRGSLQPLLVNPPSTNAPPLPVPPPAVTTDPRPQDSAAPNPPPQQVDPSFDPNAHGAY